jgi:signal transduction histidine kinase
MRFPLRWRILLFTVLPPLALTAAALWTVNRGLTAQVRAGIHDNLERASLVFENVLQTRASKLAVTAQVIASDPRFFSILAIAGASGDPHFRPTVERVARAFNEITDAELFEVVDRRGRLLASVGHATPAAAAREALLKEALLGRQSAGILVDGNRHYQVTVMPVRVERRVEGALLLGAGIAQPLARELRALTHSEVTFVSDGGITGSSLGGSDERNAVLTALARQPEARPEAAKTLAPARGRTPEAASAAGGLIEVRAGPRRYLTLARAIPQSGARQGQLYVMQRSLDDETAFLRDIQVRLLRLGVLAAVAALLAGILIAERITRPVQRLVRGAEEMERGNFEYPLGRPGRDEIGYLAERFAEMRQHERANVLSLQEAARVKSEFIALASHELRTPISVIKAYSELFAAGELGSLTPPQQSALAAIEHSVHDLERLAEDATRMAQIEERRPMLSMAAHDLAGLLEQAASSVLGEARGRRVEVTLEVASEIGSVPVDGARLAQVVSNLVRNGIRFTPDGGHVSVVARRDSGDLVIDVTDDGIGIPVEHRAGLFERPFMVRGSLHHHSSSTLEFNSGGLGLGLPIARSLVEAHGGTLTLRDAPGPGSTFTIRLPIHREDRATAA